MDVVHDFEDILELFARHGVRYLIVGGPAFIFHARPRYPKDLDLWVDAEPENVRRANRALEEFGSPTLMTVDDPDEILQLGVAPNRIDLLRNVITLGFDDVWPRRVESRYGRGTRFTLSVDHPADTLSGHGSRTLVKPTGALLHESPVRPQ